jgi:predicted metalloprotease
MQLSGKSGSDPMSNNSPNDENKKHTRTNVALIGGVIGTIAIVVYIFAAFFPSRLFSQVQDNTPVEQQPVLINAHPVVAASPLKTSSMALFAKTDEVWAKLFRQMGKKYTAAHLQLFEDTITAQACGYPLPVTGSFYCAEAKTIYLDLSFFTDIKKRVPEAAEFTRAYLIAHQAGHHIQDLLGITAKVEAQRSKLSEADYQKLVQKMEFQADFYAGVWAHYAYKKTFDNTDIDIAISSVTQTGTKLAQLSDRTQPEFYNYAVIGDRTSWFAKGYDSGDIKQGNVFAAGDLQ